MTLLREVSQCLITKFRLDIKSLSFFPCSKEFHEVWMFRQLFMLCYFLKPSLPVTFSSKLFSEPLNSIVAMINLRSHSEDISKITRTNFPFDIKDLFKVRFLPRLVIAITLEENE